MKNFSASCFKTESTRTFIFVVAINILSIISGTELVAETLVLQWKRVEADLTEYDTVVLKSISHKSVLNHYQ